MYTLSGQIMTDDSCLATIPGAGAMFFLYGFCQLSYLQWHHRLDHLDNAACLPSSAGKTTSAAPADLRPCDDRATHGLPNLSLQQEIPPGLQMFLLYPNYRGLMFSDQSQAPAWI